jgi:hypothetical protein
MLYAKTLQAQLSFRFIGSALGLPAQRNGSGPCALYLGILVSAECATSPCALFTRRRDRTSHDKYIERNGQSKDYCGNLGPSKRHSENPKWNGRQGQR